MKKMKNSRSIAVGLLSLALMASMANCRLFPTERLSGLAWQSTDPSGNSTLTAFPEAGYPSLSSKSDFGICFSGGGNRSATATLGQLRALRHTGILQRAKYISAVSGGAWGSAPWVFLQDTSAESEELFLGKMILPEDLTNEDIFDAPQKGSFAASCSNAGISILRFGRRIGGDENYGQNIGRIFLEPHGMGETNRIPVYGDREMRRVIATNMGLCPERDFLVCNESRPFFIAGSALSRRSHLISDPESLYIPLELTASYAGSRQFSRNSIDWWPFGTPVGGGYVDNAIFDGWPTSARMLRSGVYGLEVYKSTPFPFYGASSRLSLPDILGATGAAPTAVVPFLADILGFPEFNHTPLADLPDFSTRELLHTDGGAIENLGVMPLLARGVRNILVFYNTEDSYGKASSELERVPAAIGYLFRQSCDSGIFKKRGERLARMNHVFKDTDGKLRLQMVRAFDQAVKNRTTLIDNASYETIENSYHGIAGGLRVNVCWVVLGPAGAQKRTGEGSFSSNISQDNDSTVTLGETAWFDAIGCDALKNRLRKNPDLERFPNYRTFFNTGNHLINLTPVQVNTLAHFTSYSVVANARHIKSHLRIP